MKKRKILSLIVAMLMVMSSCLSVLAVNYETTSPTATLSQTDIGGVTMVNNATTVELQNIPTDAANLSFKTYQIMYATYDSSTNTMEYHLTAWAKAALTEGSSAPYASEDAAIAAILASEDITSTVTPTPSTTGQSTTEQSTVLNLLAAYIAANPSTSTWESIISIDPIWSYSTGSTSATATLPVGAYLVVPTSTNMSFINTMVSVNAGSTGASTNTWTISAKNAYLKGTVISIDKQVKESTEDDSQYGDNTDAQIGETVTYKLTVLVPQFDANISNSDITFQIVDTPTNVEIDLSSVQIYAFDGVSATGTKLNDSGTGDYSATGGGTAGTPATPQTLNIDLSINYQDLFCADGTYPYEYVEITYDATVLSTAVSDSTGNENTAELTYGHTGITSNSAEAKSKVYTYQATVLKYESGSTSTGLYGAEFKIYTVDDTTVPVSLTALTFVENSAGNYSIYTGTGTEVSTVTTDTSGNITITGLDSNTTYMIEEVVAPSGYSINSNVLTFVIEGTTGQVTSISSSAEYTDRNMTTPVSSGGSWTSNVENIALALTLADTKLAAMPAAGGVGIIIFTVIGVALMIVAVFLLNSSKGKNKEQAQ